LVHCPRQSIAAAVANPARRRNLFFQGFFMGGQMDENQQGQVAAAVAAQIQAEQQLVAARLNWNLTFQGFMIASYALVATADGSAPARQFIHGTITVAGFFVAAATLAGIVASSRQSNYLKEHWLRVLGADSIYPRPFASGNGSLLGRLPARVICWALMLMWVVLMAAGAGLF